MEHEFTSSLLEEVFSEVDSLEKSSQQTKKNSTGFLEQESATDIELILNNKRPEKKKSFKLAESIIKDTHKVASLIHEGLTDSSDDEDNKYFENAKYNECGKKINELMKHKADEASRSLSLTREISNLKSKEFSNGSSAREKLLEHLEKIKASEKVKVPAEFDAAAPSSKNNLLVDPVLNMRIINPLVSSNTLKEKMVGRISVGTLRIKKFLESPSSKNVDWVTGGAIIRKLCKTSQKGNQYCIWNISDLTGDIKTVSVFLFGSAYKEFWKTSIGTVIGILNPIVMDNSDKAEATLRVDNALKILLMGTSKDYGTCKSKTKNGVDCQSVVNTAKCDFCTYHLTKEYSRACKRSDLQPPKINGKLQDLKKKVLGKNPVAFGGKIFNCISGKKSSKKFERDQQRLKYLSEEAPRASTETKNNQQSSNSISVPETPVVNKSAVKISPPKPVERMVSLDFEITKSDRNAAKAHALNYVRLHGPIKKVADHVKVKKTPEQIASLKRKLDVVDDRGNPKRGKNEPREGKVDPIKEKLEKVGMTEKFFDLMNAGVKNKDFLTTAECEEREKHFNKLEIREKLEDKMASTYKIECYAVRCLTCNYKSFSASELCKKEKHPLKVTKAMKRFWKCGDCSARTVCLELLPLHACKTCGGTKWEKTSMMPDKGNNLTVEPLSIRGFEEKFVGATVKNANLNLLVPEELV